MIDIVTPDDPPTLTKPGWRALLTILVDQAEEEFGPDWRLHLNDPAGDE